MGQEVIITNTDLLVLKQWNDILIRIMPSLLGLLTKNALGNYFKSASELRHYPL